jgi:hypothetical protein
MQPLAENERSDMESEAGVATRVTKHVELTHSYLMSPCWWCHTDAANIMVP